MLSKKVFIKSITCLSIFVLFAELIILNDAFSRKKGLMQH
jgi:hypothetical protein